jgi:hypothetical protein
MKLDLGLGNWIASPLPEPIKGNGISDMQISGPPS